jgi:hypothetical protein
VISLSDAQLKTVMDAARALSPDGRIRAAITIKCHWTYQRHGTLPPTALTE